MYLRKLRAEFSLPRFLDQTLPCGFFQVQTQFSPRQGVLVIHFLFLKFLLEYIVLVLRCVLLLATSWIVAHQAPLSMGFSRQEHWSGLPCPPPVDLPHPAIKPAFPVSPAGGFFTTEPPGKPLLEHSCFTMLCQFLLYSEVNQLQIYIDPLFFGFPSYLGHYRALSSIPCGIQQVLTSYLFYTQQYICVDPNIPIHPTTHFPPCCLFFLIWVFLFGR